MKIFRHAILVCMEGIPSSAPSDTPVHISEDAKKYLLHCKSGSHKNGIRKSSRKIYNHIMGI